MPEVEALDRGIILARQYSLLDDPDQNPITSADVGQAVQVSITIIAPNDLHYVVIEDPIPAGAEAVNPESEYHVGRSARSRSLNRERPAQPGLGLVVVLEYRDAR